MPAAAGMTLYEPKTVGCSYCTGTIDDGDCLSIRPSTEDKMADTKHEQKSKGEQERQLTKELEETFPASDPPASTQPGSGITGPEVAEPKNKGK
jgi:hypothetical protein